MSMIVIVPTRSRPEQCKRLIQSFEATTDNAQLLFVIDGDDPAYDGFDWQGHGCAEVNPRASLVQKLNHTAKNVIDQYDELMWQGDDHEFITPHWDTKMLEVVRNGVRVGCTRITVVGLMFLSLGLLVRMWLRLWVGTLTRRWRIITLIIPSLSWVSGLGLSGGFLM